jgi:polyphenol oxidase
MVHVVMAHKAMAKRSALDLIVPNWPCPPNIRAFFTTRQGGVSEGAYASLNLGAHVGDTPAAVAENRLRLATLLHSTPTWLNQVHGTQVVAAEDVLLAQGMPPADASVARTPGTPALVLVADCLPVLFTDLRGTCVAAAHAGWRGLCAGVLEATVAAMPVPPHELMSWFGPAIGPTAFEVGAEVREAFLTAAGEGHELTDAAFKPRGAAHPGKYLADIYALARIRLRNVGVTQIYSGDFCTVSDHVRFFSYRRDGQCGRMAAAIWMEGKI